jgi:cytoskeletal protein CcmA (bactofilin family)
VLGNVRCRRLTVEEGGQISGRIEMITESAATPASGAPRTGFAPLPDSPPAPLRAEVAAPSV